MHTAQPFIHCLWPRCSLEGVGCSTCSAVHTCMCAQTSRRRLPPREERAQHASRGLDGLASLASFRSYVLLSAQAAHSGTRHLAPGRRWAQHLADERDETR